MGNFDFRQQYILITMTIPLKSKILQNDDLMLLIDWF